MKGFVFTKKKRLHEISSHSAACSANSIGPIHSPCARPISVHERMQVEEMQITSFHVLLELIDKYLVRRTRFDRPHNEFAKLKMHLKSSSWMITYHSRLWKLKCIIRTRNEHEIGDVEIA